MDAEKEIEKEKRELKIRVRLERREARRLRKEEKERKRRERSDRRNRLQQLSAEERLVEKKREQKEKRNAVLAAVGASTSADDITTSGSVKESKETRREMERQLRHEQKMLKVCFFRSFTIFRKILTRFFFLYRFYNIFIICLNFCYLVLFDF